MFGFQIWLAPPPLAPQNLDEDHQVSTSRLLDMFDMFGLIRYLSGKLDVTVWIWVSNQLIPGCSLKTADLDPIRAGEDYPPFWLSTSWRSTARDFVGKNM